ncbi:MAG: organic hydroperoxide resistance protein [Tannerellaceae bacterium]|nr:organic hydroperoxide resistance protein [Tannerellaceae bacterium]
MYTASATNTGGRSGHVRSSDGVLDLDIRPPKEMGGPGGNYTNPEQLFAAGYASCFGSALQAVALQKQKRIRPTTTARVSISKLANQPGFGLSVEMDIHIPGIEQAEAEELVKEAHQLCPYSNATRNNIEVQLKVTTNDQ